MCIAAGNNYCSLSPLARAVEVSEITIAGGQTWPGGGFALDLRVDPPDAFGAAKPPKMEISRFYSGAAIDAAAAPAVLPPGYTMMVLIPPSGHDPAAQALMAAAASTFSDTRPSDETISIYRWGERLDQLRDFTRDKDYLLEVLAAPGVADPVPAYFDADSVLTYTAGEVVRIGPADGGLRTVVFIGAIPPGPAHGLRLPRFCAMGGGRKHRPGTTREQGSGALLPGNSLRIARGGRARSLHRHGRGSRTRSSARGVVQRRRKGSSSTRRRGQGNVAVAALECVRAVGGMRFTRYAGERPALPGLAGVRIQ